jgi:hypothetical protein
MDLMCATKSSAVSLFCPINPHLHLMSSTSSSDSNVSLQPRTFVSVDGTPGIDVNDVSTFATLQDTVKNYPHYLPLFQDLSAPATLRMVEAVQALPLVAKAMTEIGMRHLYEWFLPQTKERIREAAIKKGWLSPKGICNGRKKREKNRTMKSRVRR